MSYPQLVQGVLRVLSSVSILGALGYLEVVLCIAGLCLLVAKKQWSDYCWLGLFLVVRCASSTLDTSPVDNLSVWSSTTFTS